MLAMLLSAAGGVMSAPPDAGVQSPPPVFPVESFSEELYSTCPEALPSIRLDGGWALLPPSRVARVACLMETCDDARQRSVKANDVPPGWWIAAGAAVTGAIALGIAIGKAL